MPVSTLSFRRALSDEEKKLFIDSLHNAMVDSLNVPPHDKMVRVLEFSAADFFIPNVSERYVLVEISLFSGRSIEAKRQLYKHIVTDFNQLGVPKDEIRIILNEVPAENWGLRGGQAGCDLTR